MNPKARESKAPQDVVMRAKGRAQHMAWHMRNQTADCGGHSSSGPKDPEVCPQLHSNWPTHLAPQGNVLRKALGSQDVPMDHVLHEGEVYQVLTISVGTAGKGLLCWHRAALQALSPPNCHWTHL